LSLILRPRQHFFSPVLHFSPARLRSGLSAGRGRPVGYPPFAAVPRGEPGSPTRYVMSGHSRWSTIKHNEGRGRRQAGQGLDEADQGDHRRRAHGRRGHQRQPPAPQGRPRARAENMPSDNITKAIKRGTGELEGVNYEEITYEGTGPGGTLFIVESSPTTATAPWPRSARCSRRPAVRWAPPTPRRGPSTARGTSASRRRPPPRSSSSTWPSARGAEDISRRGRGVARHDPPTEVDVVRNALEAAKIEVKKRRSPWSRRTSSGLRARRRARAAARREPRRPRRRAERLRELRRLRRGDGPHQRRVTAPG
jgi:hypothetical protein